MKYKTILFVLLLFAAGIWYRWHLASLFPHVPIADENAYIAIARDMKSQFLVAECCSRGFVYPAFLSVLMRIFGESWMQWMTIFQSIMDSAVGVFLFFISKRLFGRQTWAFLTLILYIVNPLTATYTGLILTEVPALFLLTFFLWLFIQKDRPVRQFFCGTVLGFFVFTRLMFFYWGVAFFVVFLVLRIFQHRNVFRSILPIFAGTILVTAYPSIANFVTYGTISPVPVISTVTYDFFLSLRVKRLPAIVDEFNREALPVLLAQENYSVDFFNREEYDKAMKKYAGKFIPEILNNPGPFLLSRLQNQRIFWNKSNLYFYADPFYPADRPFVEAGNFLFLVLGFWGIMLAFGKGTKTGPQKDILVVTVLLVVYLLGVLNLRIPEERFTLPVYPILFLYVPLGGSSVLAWVKNAGRMVRGN